MRMESWHVRLHLDALNSDSGVLQSSSFSFLLILYCLLCIFSSPFLCLHQSAAVISTSISVSY